LSDGRSDLPKETVKKVVAAFRQIKIWQGKPRPAPKVSAEARAREKQAEAERKAEAEAKAAVKIVVDAQAKVQAKVDDATPIQDKNLAEARAREKAEEEAKAWTSLQARVKSQAHARAKADEAKRSAAVAESFRTGEEVEAEARAKEKAEARAEADAKARDKAYAEASKRADEEAAKASAVKVRAEADVKAKAEADAHAKAKAEAAAKAKVEAYAKAKAEADAKAKVEADAKARVEAVAKAKAEAVAKAEAEAAAKAKPQVDTPACALANDAQLKTGEEPKILAKPDSSQVTAQPGILAGPSSQQVPAPTPSTATASLQCYNTVQVPAASLSSPQSNPHGPVLGWTAKQEPQALTLQEPQVPTLQWCNIMPCEEVVSDELDDLPEAADSKPSTTSFSRDELRNRLLWEYQELQTSLECVAREKRAELDSFISDRRTESENLLEGFYQEAVTLRAQQIRPFSDIREAFESRLEEARWKILQLEREADEYMRALVARAEDQLEEKKVELEAVYSSTF
jgi:hypothetical protein